jgi:hypothetical protein
MDLETEWKLIMTDKHLIGQNNCQKRVLIDLTFYKVAIRLLILERGLSILSIKKKERNTVL